MGAREAVSILWGLARLKRDAVAGPALRDCAELGLGAAAEAVAERLVELQLHNGESEGLL
jgi:hypothetical protein